MAEEPTGVQAAECRRRHGRLGLAIRQHLWDASVQAFRGRGDGRDERGNALLVCADVADPAQADAIAGWMSAHDQASIYMERHVLEALCRLGRIDGALDRIRRRYVKEILSSTTTLSEGFGDGQNHAWGGAPAIILARHLAGVRPLTPGWRRFIVQPADSALERFHLRLATAAGTVEVSSRIGVHGRQLTISVPSGSEAEIRVSGARPDPASGGLVACTAHGWLAGPGRHVLNMRQ